MASASDPELAAPEVPATAADVVGISVLSIQPRPAISPFISRQNSEILTPRSLNALKRDGDIPILYAPRKGSGASVPSRSSSPGQQPTFQVEFDRSILPKASSSTKLTVSYQNMVPRTILERYLIDGSPNVTSITGTEPVLFPLEGAIAFLDVSGFTPLTEKLCEEPDGAEKVRDILSAYFTKLLEIVDKYRGDVIKFAGDAILILWPLKNYCNIVKDHEHIAHLALQCALEAAALTHPPQCLNADGSVCTDMPTLRLKAAVASGKMFGLHIGSMDRWEFVLAGDPLVEMSSAEHEAPVGSVVLTPAFYQQVKAHATAELTSSGNYLVKNVHKKLAGAPRFCVPKHIPPDVHKRLEVYVPETARKRLEGGVPRELLADVRTVSVLFCNLLNVEVSNSDQCLRELQTAMAIAIDVLAQYRGLLRQFLQEDKGVTLIAVFGLPLLSFENDSIRCVKAALKLESELRAAGLTASIGITTGKAFCGMIGAQTRHEYGVVGPTVNLSARLMVAAQKVLLPTPAPSPQQEEHQNHETTSASPPNGSRSITRSASSRILLDKKMPPVILCDEQTQKQCKAHFEFEILAPIKVKGKVEEVPIFRPLKKVSRTAPTTSAASSVPASLPSRTSRAIGRDRERELILNAAKSVLNTSQGAIVIVQGEHGTSKTMLIDEVSQELSKATPKPMPFYRVECRDVHKSVAFFALSRLMNTLVWQEAQNDHDCKELIHESPHASQKDIGARAMYLAVNCILSDDAVVPPPQPLPGTVPGKEKKDTIPPPSTLVPYIPLLNSIFGFQLPESEDIVALDGPGRREKTFQLLVALLRWFAQDAGPIALVFDNFHEMDSSTWSVLQKMATDGLLNKIFVLLAGRPHKSEPLTAISALPITTMINMNKLDDAAMLEVLRSELDVQRVPPEVSRILLPRFFGNPFICSAIVRSLLESMVLEVREGEVVVHVASLDKTLQSFPAEIEKVVLSKIDRLHALHAMLLQVCAVIGDEIDLNLLSDVVPANMDRETLRLEMQHLEAAQFLTAVNSASDSSTPTSNSSATVSSQSGSNLIGHGQSSVASAAIEEISAYKFNSSVLREVAYKSASLRMRQTLHQKIAEWHESSRGLRTDDTLHLYQVASHWQAAGAAHRAVPYLFRASEIDWHSYNFVEAAETIQKARTVLEKQNYSGAAGSDMIPLHIRMAVYRFSAEIIWAAEGGSDKPEHVGLIDRYVSRVYELGMGRPLPTVGEIKALLPQLKRHILHRLLHRDEYLGTVMEEREILVELGIAMMLYWVRKFRLHSVDSEGVLLFWLYFFIQELFELCDAPNLLFWNGFARILLNALPTSHWKPLWRRWAVEKTLANLDLDAKRHKNPIASKFAQIYGFLFSAKVDFAGLFAHLKNLEALWEVTSPQQKRELSKLDRSLSYEETLTIHGALCVFYGKYNMVVEIASKLAQSPRVKYQKIYEEIAHRQLSDALLKLGRYKDAEETFIVAEKRGLDKMTDRTRVMHNIRRAEWAWQAGRIADYIRYLEVACGLTVSLVNFWFFVSPMISLSRSLTRLHEILKQKKAQIYSGNCSDFVGPFPVYEKHARQLPDSLGNVVAIDQKLEQIETWYAFCMQWAWRTSCVFRSSLGDCWRLYAVQLWHEGRGKLAERVVQRGISDAKRFNIPLQEAHLLFELGRHSTDSAQRIALLKQSAEMYSQLGAVANQNEIHEILLIDDAVVKTKATSK